MSKSFSLILVLGALVVFTVGFSLAAKPVQAASQEGLWAVTLTPTNTQQPTATEVPPSPTPTFIVFPADETATPTATTTPAVLPDTGDGPVHPASGEGNSSNLIVTLLIGLGVGLGIGLLGRRSLLSLLRNGLSGFFLAIFLSLFLFQLVRAPVVAATESQVNSQAIVFASPAEVSVINADRAEYQELTSEEIAQLAVLEMPFQTSLNRDLDQNLGAIAAQAHGADAPF